MAVPGTYPPSPVNGCMIGCFLTPTAKSPYAHPPALKGELESKFGPYLLDVENFRSEDKAPILDQIYKMTEQHFAMATHLLTTRPWDFFMMVEMGTDRIHHAFWKFYDSTHRKFEKGNPYENAIREYYHYVDQKIAELLTVLGEETTVFVVSDHGAKKMEGGICVNEWLIQRGYLTLKRLPEEVSPLGLDNIDWSRTKAWGEGGYYARIFLNVEGREPEGQVSALDYEQLRDEIADAVEAVQGPDRRALATVAYRPDRIYRHVRGYPPDLIVHLDDLYLRSIGSIGHGRLFIEGNDAGPDDANHAQHGVFAVAGPAVEPGRLDRMDILDIAPSLLGLMGLEITDDLQGHSVIPGVGTSPSAQPGHEDDHEADSVYTKEEQQAVEDRLRALGYL